jgi:hypothetical protein
VTSSPRAARQEFRLLAQGRPQPGAGPGSGRETAIRLIPPRQEVPTYGLASSGTPASRASATNALNSASVMRSPSAVTQISPDTCMASSPGPHGWLPSATRNTRQNNMPENLPGRSRLVGTGADADRTGAAGALAPGGCRKTNRLAVAVTQQGGVSAA